VSFIGNTQLFSKDFFIASQALFTASQALFTAFFTVLSQAFLTALPFHNTAHSRNNCALLCAVELQLAML